MSSALFVMARACIMRIRPRALSARLFVFETLSRERRRLSRCAVMVSMTPTPMSVVSASTWLACASLAEPLAALSAVAAMRAVASASRCCCLPALLSSSERPAVSFAFCRSAFALASACLSAAAASSSGRRAEGALPLASASSLRSAASASFCSRVASAFTARTSSALAAAADTRAAQPCSRLMDASQLSRRLSAILGAARARARAAAQTRRSRGEPELFRTCGVDSLLSCARLLANHFLSNAGN